ncbi:helix-turn-helix transcriptional regulator [Phyllobacterium sophorae]|jgi:DNA-binding CsgD family transcriptional regulator|uniref:Helix-turn-helix transcriptional regulator n=1 Tax=Phyllobacterium sophorae TaxID=1520277 RepID=A0A2P7B7I2_9HYPH|nr:LuxR C-terminal-related transcriptional regulator [Phyllobacterium sophorae]PSH62415.1 helix-turn-helix transcriptional regulator [Phyllobacterium sophorae]
MSVDVEMLFDAFRQFVGKSSLVPREFGHLFGQTMHALVKFDYIVVFAYRGNERPIDLYSTFDPAEHVIFVSLYQAGPYLLDPFYHTARAPRPGVWRMRELAPDRFFSSEYYRTYYVQTGLAEEIGYFVPVGNDITIVLSLMRRGETGPFPAQEFSLLRKADPLVATLVRQYCSDIGHLFDAAVAKQGRGRRKVKLNAADTVWRDLNLTDREAAIIELVLQGHSSESIGLRLSIATGTVKVHRRNVYRKLGISSQTQLLSIYLKQLNEH